MYVSNLIKTVKCYYKLLKSINLTFCLQSCFKIFTKLKIQIFTVNKGLDLCIKIQNIFQLNILSFTKKNFTSSSSQLYNNNINKLYSFNTFHVKQKLEMCIRNKTTIYRTQWVKEEKHVRKENFWLLLINLMYSLHVFLCSYWEEIYNSKLKVINFKGFPLELWIKHLRYQSIQFGL